MIDQPGKELRTIQEIAAFVGVSTSTLFRYISDHGFPAYHPCGSWFAFENEINMWKRGLVKIVDGKLTEL